MSAPWLDISVRLKQGMVHWPGDPAVSIERTSDLDHGDTANVSKIAIGSHTGTHMDAPLHFLRNGKGLDEMPLDTTVGVARVIQIHHPNVITSEELSRHRIRRAERILFKTQNSARCWKTDAFVKEFVALSIEAAHYLAQHRVRVVGVDYLSVGGYKANGAAIHRVLLQAGVWIIEGLNLSKVRPGIYELMCLPLRIHHSDGAPARAILRSIPKVKKG